MALYKWFYTTGCETSAYF